MSDLPQPIPEQHRSRRPGLRLTAKEAVALVSPSPRLSVSQIPAGIPRGDGHTVLVPPGLFRGDPFTAQVRGCLDDLGYATHGWGLGVNFGPTRQLLHGSADMVTRLAAQHGPISIVGFSMGGMFARWLALEMPGHVRQIITVCSPNREPNRNFWLPLEPLFGLWPGVEPAKLAARIAQRIPVPGTFLFSREDGLVNWTACVDPTAGPDDNIEVTGPHVLIARNPLILSVVAQRLGRPPLQPDGKPRWSISTLSGNAPAHDSRAILSP
jgi:pimeloyl-ACP methyl ester carboxylesterase